MNLLQEEERPLAQKSIWKRRRTSAIGEQGDALKGISRKVNSHPVPLCCQLLQLDLVPSESREDQSEEES